MSGNKFKILLAEDDANLGRLLNDYLTSEGYEVDLCNNGELALNHFNTEKYHLCLLDVMMPKLDGFSLAKEIKKIDSKVPIIFMTAKSMKEDKFKAYDIGADDYITKPFDEEELLWKIKVYSRRLNSTTIAEFMIGKYCFNYKNQSLTFDSEINRITEKETEVIKYLYDNRNTLVKREDLLKAVWGTNDYFMGRSLDVFISKIRKYLSQDSTLSIENVFAKGFIFNVPD
jgi:DNA-binding response OmpR family regulator